MQMAWWLLLIPTTRHFMWLRMTNRVDTTRLAAYASFARLDGERSTSSTQKFPAEKCASLSPWQYLLSKRGGVAASMCMQPNKHGREVCPPARFLSHEAT